MNTRNTNIPIECLGTPETDRQRMELADFVTNLEKRKPHHKEAKKSAELPNQSVGRLRMFRTATFDPKLKTIFEEENASPTSAFMPENNRNSG